MSDDNALAAAEKAWRDSPLRAAEQAAKAYNTARFAAMPQPTYSFKGRGDTSGGTSVEARMEAMWAAELAAAKPEHYTSVKASVDARRAQMQATITEIANRKTYQP
jgi:hypothetical protein